MCQTFATFTAFATHLLSNFISSLEMHASNQKKMSNFILFFMIFISFISASCVHKSVFLYTCLCIFLLETSIPNQFQDQFQNLLYMNLMNLWENLKFEVEMKKCHAIILPKTSILMPI